VLGSDLLEGRDALLGQLAIRAEGKRDVVRALAAAGRHAPALGVNVVGVGVGEKVTDGTRTSVLSVKVLVAKKYPKRRIPRQEQVPTTINGVPTDVEAVGYPRKLATVNRSRQRPVQAGVSISPPRTYTSPHVLAGTLGLFARDKVGRKLHFISNNHVIAFENTVPIGEPILQPGSLDGGAPGDVIARLSHVVPLRFNNLQNWMDAAAAGIDESMADASQAILGIGRPEGAARVKLNTLVRKSGRTTGLTEGVVRVVNLDLLNVEYDHGMVRMNGIFAVEGVVGAFSQSGDSGAAVVNDAGRVVGLLFAGSDAQSFVIPVLRILRRFHMRL
jgi:hypothetical protein